ncbi:MAG: substrate-binding domain-containing protein [Chitinophagaceae bacterium]|nr:substrate-binding domain-containing protein [Chitinophagaceae bacterium]MBL0200625.1 substrate-binding domain-containing protein [Chitinophagaceae bacterium]
MNRKKANRIIVTAISCFMILFFITGCESKVKGPTDTLVSGTIYISVDESFKPVMEEQIRVFEKSFPLAHIIAAYKTEADCFKDLYNDSANRMVIVTRGLNDQEDVYFLDTLKYYPHWDNIANDAVTVIVNSKSNDTLFTLERLRDQLSGKTNREQKIVFDGLNATSTVRFVMDSILKGEKFDTSVVQAVKNSQQVIDYVAKTENAVGFVGISWVGNPEDSAQVKMLNNVKIVYVSCSLCEDKPFVKPMQASILTRRYPLVRGLYYVLKENYNGLGTGFVNFLNQERGQLIFRRAYLGTRMDFGVRRVKINQKL